MTLAAAQNEPEPRSTRDTILDVAERRFAERGFTGVSMREISAEVGLRNQASLYHHFRDKRSLWEATLSRGVERLVELVARHDGNGDVLDDVLDYLGEHPHLPRLIQRAGLDEEGVLADSVADVLRPLYEQGIAVIAAMGGPWERHDLPHVAIGLYSILFGYFTNVDLFEVVEDGDLSGPAARERQRRFVRKAVERLLPGGARGSGRGSGHE